MVAIRLQGRELSDADIEQIRQLRRDHPEWSRQQLSIGLAEEWQWRNAAGRLKDMAASDFVVEVMRARADRSAGSVASGGPQKRVPRAGGAPTVALAGDQPYEGPLRGLQPIRLELVDNRRQRRRITELLQQYHYPGYCGAVGENVQYLARDAQAREMAVMVFGAAAWKVAVRGQWIGWSPRNERSDCSWRLTAAISDSPWVRMVHLASHLLAMATRRLSEDGNCVTRTRFTGWKASLNRSIRRRLVQSGRLGLLANHRANPTRPSSPDSDPPQDRVGALAASAMARKAQATMKRLDWLYEQTNAGPVSFPNSAVFSGPLPGFWHSLRGGQTHLTRAIGFHGNTQKDWSADYKVFSRCEWQPTICFIPLTRSHRSAGPGAHRPGRG